MYAFFYDAPGNEQIYGQVKEAIGDEKPPGLVLHMVSELEQGGLRHYNVWESEDAWARFDEARVRPALAKVLGAMGITQPPPPPQITELSLIDIMTNA
jgi:hypothetical protein